MTDIGYYKVTCEVVITSKEYQCGVGGKKVLNLLCKLVEGEAELCWTWYIRSRGDVVLGCLLGMHSAIMVLKGDNN